VAAAGKEVRATPGILRSEGGTDSTELRAGLPNRYVWQKPGTSLSLALYSKQMQNYCFLKIQQQRTNNPIRK
jgi:hypothetical protein